MQVLLVLADAAGQVVTRDTLFARCWGGVFVGDDSLNRAVAALRRAVEAVGGTFEVETIPRTGYRLVGATVSRASSVHGPPRSLSRRQVAGGAIGVAALCGIAGWSIVGRRRRFEVLIASAEDKVRKGTSDDSGVRKQLLEAISIRPDSARAWGLLAYLASIGTVSANPKIAEPALKEAQHAAAKALALYPRDPYALLAMFELQGSTLDWATRDQRLRQIIAIDPMNLPAIGEIVLLTQAAGLNRESWNWNERAIALEPFSFDFLSKRALKLWIAGDTPQADKVIDQVQALYPTDPWPGWVRFLIYAMTGRPRAAQAVAAANPAFFEGSGELPLWRTALVALDRRSSDTIAATREACFNAAETIGAFAVDGVMILSALGQIDAAFEIANGFLLSRGLIVTKRSATTTSFAKGKSSRDSDLNDATWRVNTQYLFTPPCAVMRADPRFLPLCEGMGLVDYWRALGVRPDYQLRKS
jgi:tetratricopeptide (TPR) repeat protein